MLPAHRQTGKPCSCDVVCTCHGLSLQASLGSSSGDDEMPLAMLPAATSTAKRPAASSRDTPASLPSQSPSAAHAITPANATAAISTVSLPKSALQVSPELLMPSPDFSRVSQAVRVQGTGGTSSPQKITAGHLQPAASSGPTDMDTEAAEAVTADLSPACDHASLAAAPEDAISQGQNDWGGQAISDTAAAGDSHPTVQQAQLHGVSPKLINAAAAIRTDDLVSDSESEGQAGTSLDAGFRPQLAPAAPMEHSQPAADAREDMLISMQDRSEPAQHHQVAPEQQSMAHALPMHEEDVTQAVQVNRMPVPKPLAAPLVAAYVQTGSGRVEQQHEVAELPNSSPSMYMRDEAEPARCPPTTSLPLHNSSESLQQAEAEAARLALLLTPALHRQPTQTQQLEPPPDAADGSVAAVAPSGHMSAASVSVTAQCLAKAAEHRPAHVVSAAGQSVARPPAAVIQLQADEAERQAGLQQQAMRLAKQQVERLYDCHESSALKTTEAPAKPETQARHEVSVDEHAEAAVVLMSNDMLTSPGGVADLIIPDR